MRKENMHKKKEILEVANARIEQKNTEYNSLIACDTVEYHANHLMFYNHKTLNFKVWLKKDYKNIKQALKDVGITSVTRMEDEVDK